MSVQSRGTWVLAAGHACVLVIGDGALERIIRNVQTEGEEGQQTEEVRKRDCSHSSEKE